MQINKLVIDSSDSTTYLCLLGAHWGTDKSPYNIDDRLHKHPYTAVYNFLFSSIRYNEINVAEIGILDNKSMRCWRDYFPKAHLYGFEWFDNRIEAAKLDKQLNTFYYKMNVEDESSITKAFESAGKQYDVIIEDSTHKFEDQIRVAHVAYKYMVPGSILVIEDVFRNADESLYETHLNDLSKYFSSATFVVTEHKLRWSPGWDNDKLLILHRNDVP